MSFDYTKTAATALRLLTRYGADVTRTATTPGVYDPATGTTTPTTADTARKGVKLPLPSGVTTVRGQIIQVEDAELLLDAEGDVAITDRYTVGGTVYTVVSFEPLAPAGTSVLNTLHIRKP